MKFVWVFMYVYIGMPIKSFFYYESQGRGGGEESKLILWEYRFKKTSKSTDNPLFQPMLEKR